MEKPQKKEKAESGRMPKAVGTLKEIKTIKKNTQRFTHPRRYNNPRTKKSRMPTLSQIKGVAVLGSANAAREGVHVWRIYTVSP